MKHSLRPFIVGLLLLLGLGVTARAQTFLFTDWLPTTAGSYDYHNSGNWSDGVPDINLHVDGATFEDSTFQFANIGTNTTAAVSTLSATADFLLVGTGGAGITSALAVQAGGKLEVNSLLIGVGEASTGTVLVSGSGSELTSYSLITIGQADFFVGPLTTGVTGSLTVSNGGIVNGDIIVALDPLSSGSVTVTGLGSTVNGFIFGGEGNATISITDSARVNGSLGIGGAGVSSFTVDGGASLHADSIEVAATTGGTSTGDINGGDHTVSEGIFVGGTGTSTLTVRGGATLDGSGATFSSVIGDGAGETGTMTLTGNLTSWTNSKDLVVGDSGTGTFEVLAAATSSHNAITLGDSSGGSGTVTVSGSGSNLTATGALRVGDSGSGSFTVSDDATASSQHTYIGANSGTTNTLTVTTGGTFTTGELYVGYASADNASLTVSAGGTLTSGASYVGYGGTAASATVTGSGSTWNVGSLLIAKPGVSNASLDISAGGLVANSGDAELGHLGTAAVNVNGGTWTNAGAINFNGGTGTLTVAGGGSVTATGINIPSLNGSSATINIGAAANAGAAAPGTLYLGGGSGSITAAANPLATATVVFNHTGIAGDNYTFNSTLAGELNVVHHAGYTTLSGTNTYTEGTVIDGGTLALGANNALGSGNVALGGGTLALGGFSQTAGTLLVTSNSLLDFNSLAGALTFTDSSALIWGGTLTITNYNSTFDSLRFGTDASGLTSTQLGLINFNGTAALINSSGYLTAAAIPEPSTYAAALASVALVAAAYRRRKFAVHLARN